ncbi:hypothetical protein F5Y15DRAFT_363086 [Xylariaceae sp. FL0016]|nr:hypothetical protein F5Y15DRAFT_363086 [Xylariaceae sp. FL0016]
MWYFRLGQLALASIVVLAFGTPTQAQDTGSNNDTGIAASIFVSPERDLAFALNVPDDSSSDLFFSLVIPKYVTWGAVGLGSGRMAGSLMLMTYASASGRNVTISPRIAHGHSEPVYSSDIQIEALAGTGLINDTTLIFNGRCSNCRSWTNGKLDVSNNAEDMLYATGETGDMKSDDPAAPLRMHYNYGTFTMDLVRATGDGGTPVIPASNTTESAGAVQGLDVEGKKDMKAVAHAIIMVFVFIGIYPFGILVLRLGNWMRWHAINQVLGLVLFIIGAGLGFAISGTYNRTKKFNTAHQVIGIFVLIFLLVQFGLGFMHHRMFKKTQQPTKLAPAHVWLGRFTVLLGVINAFLGFPLALSPGYDYVLAGLVLFIAPAIVLLLITKKFIQKWWAKSKEERPNGYDMEPWQHGEGQAQGQSVGARGVTIAESGQGPAPTYQPGHRKMDLGPQQSVREYV